MKKSKIKNVRRKKRWILGIGYPWFKKAERLLPERYMQVGLTSERRGYGTDVCLKHTAPWRKYRLVLEEI